ncbi:MAG: alpha/beta fold hydrolase [Planctomycetes bacterium]|nr:alpha/beta fold hydrolase [Planctomycetota bacterium]
MLVVLWSVLGGYALLAVVLFFAQSSLIYHPRAYAPAVVQALPTGLVGLRDPDGSLIGFYRPPHAGGTPQRLWFCFGGNADQALGWDAFADEHASPGTGFLLLEYPGYGACAGKPSPTSMLAANERAVVLLAAHLGLVLDEVHRRAGAVGHSLGAAAALQYAVKHPLRRLVLISPFTTMTAMARRTVGWPLCELLVHRFDNVARVGELAVRGLPPTTIVHGGHDEFIPVTMGRDLAAAHPDIHLSVIVGAGHNDVLAVGAGEINAAMGE